MPKFSNKSDMQLDTCHDLLQELFRAVVREDDCTVIEGHRNRRRQNQLFRQGKSRLKWPKGKHNVLPSLAVDVAPFVEGSIPWDDTRQFYYFAGKVKARAAGMGILIRWGGDWDDDGNVADQRFNDLAHWELISTTRQETHG